MSVHLSVPDEAVRYILLQRTGYLRFPLAPIDRHVLSRLPVHLPVYNVVTTIEARLRRSRIKKLYSKDMHAEYTSIRDYLPEACASVLDIGCGAAGIDVLIDQHYVDQSLDIYLLDKTEVERNVFYMFQDRAAFYNSLDTAKDLLTANGIPAERIHLREANAANEIQVPNGVDLVISLLSWGFHYPVATYADRVKELLSIKGVAILDIRKGTDGLDTLGDVFSQVHVILDASKYVRVAARRS
jgi:SAM-dependent methyltransferase